MNHVHDLVVVGAGPTALSIAADAQGRGLGKVLVLAPGEEVVPSGAPGRYGLTVRFRQPVERTEVLASGQVVLESATDSFLAQAAVIVDSTAGAPPTFPVAADLVDRVHSSASGFDPVDQDVLVVGEGDRAVEETLRLVEADARVVLAFDGRFEALSHLAQEQVVTLEHDRRLTVLWHSEPDAVEAVDGYPLVYFSDRRTPDLSVDHLVCVRSSGASEPALGGPLYRVDDVGPARHPLGPATAWETIAAEQAETLPLSRPPVVRAAPGRAEAALRRDHYNATITYFDHSHEDLWVIRVRPDRRETSHVAGQYTTLGLGYWEPRADDRDDVESDARRSSVIRRSYSISSRILDRHGYLVDPARADEIEFYIVHVRPDGDRVPALTPRLALKRSGDRIYLGPRIVGRYTLDAVSDPGAQVVFLATGTGEAPHNAMIAELLRKGHHGPVVSVVSVRHRRDLGYEDVHRTLESRFHNYAYVTLPTREPDVPKRYVQDFVRSGELDELVGGGLDPEGAHVFLCGNPSMIGLPTWEDDRPVFPEPTGVAELLHRRGFTIDRRGAVGNVHYEEYW